MTSDQTNETQSDSMGPSPMMDNRSMPPNDTQEVIRTAAFALFAEDGYEVTTVEDIVRAAGVARSTFFRLFGSKEAVIFPDHDELLASVEARLASTTEESALLAVTDAVKVVLFHYVAEGERARERYRLTSSVPTLRERELVSGARYQRLFRRYLSSWGTRSETDELHAELVAAGVVAAHNRVLRRWLRGEIDDPQAAVTTALQVVAETYAGEHTPEVVVVVAPPGVSSESIVRSVQNLAT